MEITPTILQDVYYDTKQRTFYCNSLPKNPFEAFGARFQFSIDKPIINSPVLEITRPTYMRLHYHSCFGHAYIDETFPLISILHEFDPGRLARRDFQLFILKDFMSDYYTNIEFERTWEEKTIDYTRGSYKGSYAFFHQCISTEPVLFEKTIRHRFIHFPTLIYGGNDESQRAILNSEEKYPDRKKIPCASDEQTKQWLQLAKQHVAQYLEIPVVAEQRDKILLIARKGVRQFTGRLISFLQLVFKVEPIFLEEYTLKEQIELFQSASTIIAAHGSGITHCVWAAPGTHLIELFAGNDPRKQIYKSLTEVLGIQYTRIELSDIPITIDINIDITNDDIVQKIMNLHSS